MKTSVLVATLVVVAAAPAAAQTDSAGRRACGPLRAGIAIQEVMALNLFVNRYDAWVAGEEWARADFESWARNLRLGWEWDENAFLTNMFGHPFHGSTYFNSGRSNCLTFWESIPLAFLGSFTWEYFGETYRPSLNDFFMTSFGGIALGEMTHRVAATIRNNQLRGPGRIVREIAALPVDPMGSLNRLFRGEWWRVMPNQGEHDPGAFLFRVSAGARVIKLDSAGKEHYHPTILAEVNYGDPFDRASREPFDVFTLRAQMSPAGGGGMNVLQATGRLFQSDLPWSWGRQTRHVFAINQRYDFVHNALYSFGQQSVEAGVFSRFGLKKGFTLRSRFAGDAAILGAIDAPYSGVGERTYDFGPGLGGSFELVLERRGFTYISFYNRGEYLHSVSGATANHFVFFSGLDWTIPLWRGIGIGGNARGDSRSSKYADGSESTHQFFESRIFLSWTSARGARVAR